jgi:two-component system response regulator CpxR
VILFVSDDERLARLVTQALRHNAFAVACERDARHCLAGLATCDRRRYRLVLVDAAAAEAGFALLLRNLRRKSHVPLIVIAADRDPGAAATLLESGADDCISRPVDPGELVARVRAVLRRTFGPCGTASTQFLEAGDIRIEPATRIVSVEAAIVDCTAIEYDILEYLARRLGEVVLREELMLAVCGRQSTPLDRALDVHISHLRRKLGAAGERIVTIRGIGYMLTGRATRRTRLQIPDCSGH